MKLVLALRTHDHADTLDASLSFHLNLGVSLVVAIDAGSSDGTVEILEAYAREGVLRLLGGGETRTRMAELSASEGADWVLHAEGDEFLWPRGSDFEEVLASVPPRYQVVRGLVRSFPPTSGVETFEGRVARLTIEAELADAHAAGRPVLRVAHRALRGVVVDSDSVGLAGTYTPLRGWYPFEVLTFPPGASTERQLVEDTRLQDALRGLRRPTEGGRAYALPSELERAFELPRPSIVDDASYAVDVAAVGEADISAVRERLDRLEGEIARLERGFWRRLGRKVDGLRTRGAS